MELIEGRYRYFAFISYKREDEQWARWLQQKLEHYKLPSNLNGRTDLPREIRPVFKDTSELTPGNLPEQIHEALNLSKYLVVICSPRSAQSEWVNKEVVTFIEMERTERIIPFIIEGSAFAKHPADECFPLALRQLPEDREILGANVNEMGRDAAAVKVVARMFDIRFDELWQRYEREKKRRRNLMIAVLSAFVLAVISVAGWIWNQNVELKEKNYQVLIGQSRFVAETAIRLSDQGENYMAARLALDVLQNNPYTPEAEAALRKAWQGEGTTLCDSIGAGMAVFSPDGKFVAASFFEMVSIWDSYSGQLLLTKKMGEEQVTELAFNKYGTILQTIDIKGMVRQWDVPEGRLRNEKVDIPIRSNQIEESSEYYDDMANCAVYNSDSSLIAVAYRNGYARVWDTSTGDCVYDFDGKDVALWSVDFFPDSKRLLVATDHYVRILDLPQHLSFIQLNTSEDNFSPFWKLSFTPDSKCLISTSGDMMIRCWNVESGRILWAKEDTAILDVEDDELGNSEAFSPDGKTIAKVDNYVNVLIFKTGTDKAVWHLHTADPHDVHDMVSSIAFSPDGRFIAVGSRNGNLRVYRYPPLEELIEETRERFKNCPLAPEERRKYYLE